MKDISDESQNNVTSNLPMGLLSSKKLQAIEPIRNCSMVLYDHEIYVPVLQLCLRGTLGTSSNASDLFGQRT